MFAQPRQPRDQTLHHRLGDAHGEGHAARKDADLGTHRDLLAFALEKISQQGLGMAVAVGRCHVKPADTGIIGSGQCRYSTPGIDTGAKGGAPEANRGHVA